MINSLSQNYFVMVKLVSFHYNKTADKQDNYVHIYWLNFWHNFGVFDLQVNCIDRGCYCRKKKKKMRMRMRDKKNASTLDIVKSAHFSARNRFHGKHCHNHEVLQDLFLFRENYPLIRVKIYVHWFYFFLFFFISELNLFEIRVK